MTTNKILYHGFQLLTCPICNKYINCTEREYLRCPSNHQCWDCIINELDTDILCSCESALYIYKIMELQEEVNRLTERLK